MKIKNEVIITVLAVPLVIGLTLGISYLMDFVAKWLVSLLRGGI